MPDSKVESHPTLILHKGDRVVLTCDKAINGGLCRAFLSDGTLVFVSGGISGEVVEVELQYRKRAAWFAKTVSVQKPSLDRVAPPCPYFGTCGGCQLQHMSYELQLSQKQQLVLETLTHEHVPIPELVHMHGVDHPWAYRWRGEFHVIPGTNGMEDAELGFNEERKWTAIPVADCQIHHPSIRASLGAIQTLVRTAGTGSLQTIHMTVGENGNELLLRAKPQSGIRNDLLDSMATTEELPVRWAVDATTLSWRDMAFRVTPEAFIQVNWTTMERLYACVLEALFLAKTTRVLDAYAGIGVLSAAIAKAGNTVLCIESNPHSVKLAMLNARMNNVHERMVAIKDTVEHAIGEFDGTAFDAIVLDPPRSGCEGTVMGWCVLKGPQTIVYVSCNPATLARDLHILVALGPYRLDRVELVDMFPQTHHIETVAVLTRRPPD